MPISPDELKEKVIKDSDISGIVSQIERELVRAQAVDGGTIEMTKYLKDFAAEKVAEEFRKAGWNVTYDTISDQRDGDYTCFTLSPALKQDVCWSNDER